MAEEHKNNQTGEAQEAHTGQAQRADTRAVRARAETPGLLRQEELDARQAQLGADRRSGGPPLDEELSAESVPADVPATESEEPEE